MTQKKYFAHLVRLAGLEGISADGDPRDQLFGYFQCFMPDGKNVERVFDPFPRKEIYIERIRAVYAATEKKIKETIAEGVAPGYFVPPPIEVQGNVLPDLGKELLEQYKKFAAVSGDGELTETLEKVAAVEITGKDKSSEQGDTDIMLYEAVCDYVRSVQPEDQLLDMLDEAYYSIACDYFLAFYLQFPQPETEFLAPHFKLWQLGRSYRFTENKLLIENA